MLHTKNHQVDKEPFDMTELAYFWEYCYPASFQEAQERFVQEVDPYVMHMMVPQERDIAVVQMLFTEWLVFDYHAADGKSPLEHFVDTLRAAGRLPEAQHLQQVGQSQFFAQFWVIAQDVEHSTVLLSERKSHQLFHVHNRLIAINEAWDDGLLGVRIAHIDGMWRVVSSAPLHDQGPCKADHVCVSSKSSSDVEHITQAARSAQSFLLCIRDLIGVHGRYRESVRVQLASDVNPGCAPSV